MKQILVIMAAVVLVGGCASTSKIQIVPNNATAKAELEAAIRKAAGKPNGKLTNADFQKVTKIENSLGLHRGLGPALTDISPLAELTNLKRLTLGSHRLTDISPLAKLVKLEELSLDNNQITNLGPLARLKQLKSLHLGNQGALLTHRASNSERAEASRHILKDISPLVGLRKLEELILDGNNITNINALAGLTQLRELSLRNNPNLTKAELEELQKALPNCRILSNPTK